METFKINAYSGPEREIGSIWANQWRCPFCNWQAEGEEWLMPLHNPLYCTGTKMGDKHVRIPMRPSGQVFYFDPKNMRREDAILIGEL